MSVDREVISSTSQKCCKAPGNHNSDMSLRIGPCNCLYLKTMVIVMVHRHLRLGATTGTRVTSSQCGEAWHNEARVFTD